MRLLYLATTAAMLVSSPAWAQTPGVRPLPGVSPPSAAKSAAKPSGAESAPGTPSDKDGSQSSAAKDATKQGVVDALQRSGPITAERVNGMGKNADLLLIDLVRDNKADSQVRARAIDGLAASGSAVARDQLVRIATATGEELEESLLRRALLGLGWIRDGRAVDVISPWLSHKTPAVRLDAAVALAVTKTPAALELLERHGRAEKDAGVRAKVDRLIRQLRHELPQEATSSRRRQEQPRVQPPGPVEGRNSTRF